LGFHHYTGGFVDELHGGVGFVLLGLLASGYGIKEGSMV
jgi:hypothetical protein